MLIKLLEGQTRLEIEVSNVKGDVNGVKNDISSVKNDINGVKDDISSLKNDTKKNSIKLEAIEKNINKIAEVQTSHNEQNEITFKNMDSVIEEKASLIEAAVKNISKDVREVKESIEVLKDMTGRHEVDINILKRRPV